MELGGYGGSREWWGVKRWRCFGCFGLFDVGNLGRNPFSLTLEGKMKKKKKMRKEGRGQRLAPHFAGKGDCSRREEGNIATQKFKKTLTGKHGGYTGFVRLERPKCVGVWGIYWTREKWNATNRGEEREGCHQTASEEKEGKGREGLQKSFGKRDLEEQTLILRSLEHCWGRTLIHVDGQIGGNRCRTSERTLHCG